MSVERYRRMSDGSITESASEFRDGCMKLVDELMACGGHRSRSPQRISQAWSRASCRYRNLHRGGFSKTWRSPATSCHRSSPTLNSMSLSSARSRTSTAGERFRTVGDCCSTRHVLIWLATGNPRARAGAQTGAVIEQLVARALRSRRVSDLILGDRHVAQQGTACHPSLDPAGLLEGFLRNRGMSVIDVTAELGIRAGLLEGLHGDPADRVIVATALEGHELVTQRPTDPQLERSAPRDRRFALRRIDGADSLAPCLNMRCAITWSGLTLR